MNSKIANPELAASGLEKIQWAAEHMPVLSRIGDRFEKERPFEGLNLALSIHLEAKTAYLAKTLMRGGANVFATGSNPLSTQDDVCAGLAAQGVTVCAAHGCSDEEYTADLERTLRCRPHLLLDDGGDMVQILHSTHPEYAENLIGGCEETTTGVLRLKARAKAGTLRFPMVLVNDADCKHLFDNRYGTGQSVWDGILRTTNLLVAGKNVVVAGYGWCGRGVAMRAKGLGARVIVTEVDSVKAIEAVMDGFTVLPMSEAAPIGDFFITVTGCRDIIDQRHFDLLKDGAVLCNAGHFDVEVAMAALKKTCVRQFEARKNIMGYEMPGGKKIYVLAEGRLVNLAAGDGHPAEIMDMSFAVQALTLEYLVKEGKELKEGVYLVPSRIDQDVAAVKLETMGVEIDTLTEAQRAYLEGAGE